MKKVEAGLLTLEQKSTKEVIAVPFGLAVWCTGIKLNPLWCAPLHSDGHPSPPPTGATIRRPATLALASCAAACAACIILLLSATPRKRMAVADRSPLPSSSSLHRPRTCPPFLLLLAPACRGKTVKPSNRQTVKPSNRQTVKPSPHGGQPLRELALCARSVPGSSVALTST